MSNKIVYLSYFLGMDTPLFGGKRDICIFSEKSIDKGDSCNTLNLTFPNHAGTHIDAPFHFIRDGKTITDYPSEFWKFERPILLGKEVVPNEIIDISKEIERLPDNIDLLLLKTSFGNCRNTVDYWSSNPGILPSNASLLRKKCPYLKAIGFDFISISSYNNRALGRDAHREFLNNEILIIEDMDLTSLTQTPSWVIGLPLLLHKADGAPITIIANLT